MKACVLQPLYSARYEDADRLFEEQLRLLDQCDGSMDLIVLPEAGDVPSYAATKEEFLTSVARFNAPLLEKAAETARRCGALVFASAMCDAGTGLRNTTYAFNRRGELVGKYFKQHPVNASAVKRGMDSEYSYEWTPVTVLEIEGVRYGFLTCYDFYFYEMFARMAREKLDVIIGCSHQRTDTHRALEMFTCFAAYNCDAYVVRASVSMGEDSPVGGAGMIVAPDGNVLMNMGSRVGLGCAEFDPHWKYLKSAGYMGRAMPHYEYTEMGRRPWKYRPAGSFIARDDACMRYPRVCAHRGFNTVAPENSLPALGAAVAMGAEEIEFDLWPTKDGELISLHDSRLDRVSNGTGPVWEHTLEELQTLDFGGGRPGFEGLGVLTFEELLRRLSCHAVMNIHIKTRSNTVSYDEALLRKIISLLDAYDCKKHCYFMTGNDTLLRQLGEAAPGYVRCVGGGDDPWGIVDRAIAMGCEKVQLLKPYFNQEMIDKAHAHGIRCNVFWSDDPEETERFLNMGIDTILTNDYLRIARAVKAWKKEKED